MRIILVLGTYFLAFVNLVSQVIPYNTIPDSFYAKDSVKIIVTDSGLGGLSIAAVLNEKIKTTGLFKHVDIVFINAQPHLKTGYNSMDSTYQKVTVFNNALVAMDREFNPDIILIGCNTLSVIYELTEFSKNAEIPVIGIVDTGVDLIFSNIKNNDSKVILFATKTTCSQAKHKTQLVEQGVSADRIIMIPCHKLAGNIERDSESPLVDSLVTGFVDEAIKELGNNNKNTFVSYNCTHYGYIDSKFREKFKERGLDIKGYLNPNPMMVDIVLNKEFYNRYNETTTSISVFSQAELTPAKIGSIYLLIEPTSIESAEALLFYEFTPDFFEWESVIN